MCVGHDTDPEGEMSFSQPDNENTFSEILTVLLGDLHIGAAVIGIASIALLVFWDRIKPLKNSIVPGPLVVVLLGVLLQYLFRRLGGSWVIESSHLVQIPVAESVSGFVNFLTFPDFSQWANPAIYVAAVTIAIVASLETLLNLDAVDKLDPERRDSPPSRELVAQGVGNTIAGLIGGLPMTSVIVRSSVNVGVGAKTKLSSNHARRITFDLCRDLSVLPEHDSAGGVGGNLVGHRFQTCQPVTVSSNVERRSLSVHSVHRDTCCDRVHRLADRDSDWSCRQLCCLFSTAICDDRFDGSSKLTSVATFCTSNWRTKSAF